jgi:hypothetical protein
VVSDPLEAAVYAIYLASGFAYSKPVAIQLPIFPERRLKEVFYA